MLRQRLLAFVSLELRLPKHGHAGLLNIFNKFLSQLRVRIIEVKHIRSIFKISFPTIYDRKYE